MRRTISDILGTPAPGTPNPPTGHAAKAPGRALVPTQAPVVPRAPAATPPDATAALAAELTDLTETLDAMATLVASVSDRVDAQTTALSKLAGTATEARQAAFAARAQSDPGQLASEVDRVLQAALLPRLRELTGAVERYGRTTEDQDKGMAQLKGQVADLTRDLRHARERAALWRARLPGIGGATLLLVLALAFLLPRFAGHHVVGCWLMGGEWRNYALIGEGTSCWFETPGPGL